MAEHVIELVNISKSFDDNIVLDNLNLSVKQGEFLTLLGPSGCGKTTLLRIISGLEMPDAGIIFLNGENITHQTPEQRHTHTVFQSYALFPHMNVYDNVAFGLRCHKAPKDEIDDRVKEALQVVKLEKYVARMPSQLSGGQQQRVAIARAIVNHPKALLLDEPLSSLDYRLRKNMQMELKQIQRKLGIAFIFVTHDQEEALSMSDRVVVMHEGVIEQIGTPREVYEKPKNLTVAKFIGEINIFDVHVKKVEDKYFYADIEGIEIKLANSKNFHEGDHLHLIIRPEDVRVWDRSEVDDISQMLPATVEEVVYKGSTVDLIVRLQSGVRMLATEFFDEDDENLEYSRQEQVYVQWLIGWEVCLPYEEQN